MGVEFNKRETLLRRFRRANGVVIRADYMREAMKEHLSAHNRAMRFEDDLAASRSSVALWARVVATMEREDPATALYIEIQLAMHRAGNFDRRRKVFAGLLEALAAGMVDAERASDEFAQTLVG